MTPAQIAQAHNRDTLRKIIQSQLGLTNRLSDTGVAAYARAMVDYIEDNTLNEDHSLTMGAFALAVLRECS
jgi:hypothetical protein